MQLRTRLALGVSAAFGLALSAVPLVAHADPPAPATGSRPVVERTNGRVVYRFERFDDIRAQRQLPLQFINTRARDVYVRPDVAPPFAPQVIHATRETPF